MQKLILIVFFFIGTLFTNGQDSQPTVNNEVSDGKEPSTIVRPKNAIIAALGGAVANGDLPDAKFDLNMQIGYKRSLGSGFNLNLTYNKFNIVFQDVYNEGFMSFDLDLEYMFFPEKAFTPYLYAGPGLHAANGFENSDIKFQFGLGMEVMVSDAVGFKLYADRNFLGNDTLDGFEAGAGNDSFYKVGFGANFYFPRNSKRVKKGEPTFIKKNKLDDF